MERALSRAKETQLLLLDVDGVLTDGSLVYTTADRETKTFHSQDGLGLQLLHEAGIKLGIISARKSSAVEKRGKDLKFSFIFQGVRPKNEAFKQVIRETGLKPFEVAYMGDDWLDLPILQQVGLALAPANAVPEVLEMVHYVTKRSGGAGAVREVCDLILQAQGRTEELLQKYKRR